jgi:hypothetical protein
VKKGNCQLVRYPLYIVCIEDETWNQTDYNNVLCSLFIAQIFFPRMYGKNIRWNKHDRKRILLFVIYFQTLGDANTAWWITKQQWTDTRPKRWRRWSSCGGSGWALLLLHDLLHQEPHGEERNDPDSDDSSSNMQPSRGCLHHHTFTHRTFFELVLVCSKLMFVSILIYFAMETNLM